MSKSTHTDAKALYLALSLVGLFLIGLLISLAPNTNYSVKNTEPVQAGSQEPVDETAPPIGGSDEVVITTATPKPTVKPTPSATPSATPYPTIFFTPAPIVNNLTSPTPAPTYNLNLPGDTENTVPTTAPVVSSTKSNNLPLIIGIIAGVLLIAGGIVLVLVRKQRQNEEFQPPTGPAAPKNTPYQPPAQPTDQFTTPYDQYMSNQPNNQSNQQQ